MKTIRTLFQFVVAALVLLPAYAGAQTDTIPGYTLQFNGSSHVDLGNSTDFNFSGSFTLEAWIKVDQFTHDWQAILTKGDSEWRLHRNSSSNFIAFGTTNLVDGSNNPDLVGTTNVNDGLWHHLAAVYDASALTKYFYVDGNLDASTSVTGTLGADSYSAYIGENAEQTGRQWQGNIDEVRIWNIARTAAQIRSTVHRTLTGSETGLLDYYQFNNGSGTTLTDAKAVHNGTLVNSPSWVSSTVAIGRGNEVSTTGFTSGTVSLGNISMTTTDAFDNPVDIYAFEIPLIPNHYPGGASAFQGSRYWVVNVYGNGGTYSTNLTFTYPSGELTAGSAANLSLYHRSGGSDGSWTSAVAVATSLTSMTVEFDGVTSFSQFAVSNNQMTYVSSTVTQDSDRVFFGSTSQEVIGIQVVMGGEVNPLNITQFDLSTSGTTSSSDISNARIYSTGTSSTFSTSTQYGSTVVSPSGSFSVTGSQSLTTGTNYFWLTYDVSGSAVPGDLIDGACTSMTIGGVSKTPSPTSPTGSRTVVGTDTIPGSALSFDGSGTYISIPNSSVLNPSTAVTIEAWVYPTATNNLRGIFYAGSSGYKLSIHNGALESEIWLDNGFGGQGSLLNGSSIPAFQWSHVAVTYEKNGSYDIYLNDSLVVTSSALSYNLLPSSSTMAIGVWYPGLATNVFSGAIDEVRIWGVARTKDEIREDMHTTLRGNESGLIAYFQFNEGSGSTTTSHVNSLVGTLGGGTGWQTSTVPVGGGTSAEQDGFTSGTASLGPVSLTTTNAFDNAVDLTATQINQSPNVLPGLSSHELSDRYWVVDATGTPGTFSTNLTFTVPASFTNNGAASAALYTLYHRNSTSDGSWTAVVSGATSISSTSVTFDGVTSFSQFTIGTNDPLPVQMSIVSAKVHENVVTLRWHASTEVDNAGFGVERRELSNPQSTNGSPQWLSLGFVEGAGTSTALKSYSFTDQSVPPGHYAYRLKQVDRSGAFTYSAEMTVEVGMAPRVFALAQNYPNPFNPTTAIEFTVPSDGRVVLKVYDMTGQEVTTLVDQDMKAGVHQRVSFDASKMASGIYFARLEYGGRQLLRKMILMK